MLFDPKPSGLRACKSLADKNCLLRLRVCPSVRLFVCSSALLLFCSSALLLVRLLVCAARPPNRALASPVARPDECAPQLEQQHDKWA